MHLFVAFFSQFSILYQHKFGPQHKSLVLGQIFLLVDLRDFFSDLGSGDGKKRKKKNSENDQLTGLKITS